MHLLVLSLDYPTTPKGNSLRCFSCNSAPGRRPTERIKGQGLVCLSDIFRDESKNVRMRDEYRNCSRSSLLFSAALINSDVRSLVWRMTNQSLHSRVRYRDVYLEKSWPNALLVREDQLVLWSSRPSFRRNPVGNRLRRTYSLRLSTWNSVRLWRVSIGEFE